MLLTIQKPTCQLVYPDVLMQWFLVEVVNVLSGISCLFLLYVHSYF